MIICYLWNVGLALLFLFPAGIAAGAASIDAGYWDAQTGTPAPEENTVLFEDDFATYSNRWNERKSPKSSTVYRDGGFELRVVSPGVGVVSVPDFRLAVDTYTLQAVVESYAGETDSLFGCALAYEDADTYYAFLVSVDGDWQFFRVDDGEWIDLSPPDRDHVTGVGADDHQEIERLRVDVAIDTFEFWTGTRHLGTVTVEDAPRGSGFGLVARAGHGAVNVVFDTVVVTEWLGDMERGTTD